MNNLSLLLTLKLFQTCSFFLLLNTEEDILKNVGNQTVDGSHWLLYYGVAAVNCLITNILQNTFFCVQQKKGIHTGLKQLEGE